MSIDVAASGLLAQRIRMDVIANNIANAQTTRTADGGPYRRRGVIFEAVGGLGHGKFSKMLDEEKKGQLLGQGVQVTEIIEQQGDEAFIEVYDPTHPDANENGILRKPDIRIADEMVNLIDASRAYEANLRALLSVRQADTKTLEIGRS